MKLLFIFTGGTIGSTQSGDTISVDAEKPYLLCEKYAEQHPVDFTYDTLEPFSELSENFSGAHISALLDAVTKHAQGYDGIVVTHGTDTLGYSAAALGYALGNASLPVCLVSANFPIENEHSNGIANLYGAISLIKSGDARGVFVPYQNNEGECVYIHRATRLSTTLSLVDDVFSVLECPYGYVNAAGVFTKNPDFTEKEDALPPPPSLTLSEKSEGLLRVFPYPGMPYPEIPNGTRAILLDTYHSGTVDGKSAAAHAFLGAAKEKGIPVYVTGNAAYDSTHIFDEHGVTRLSLSPVAAYIKLWLYGSGCDLSLSRGGDIF